MSPRTRVTAYMLASFACRNPGDAIAMVILLGVGLGFIAKASGVGS